MKKEYIKPVIKSIELDTNCLLAGSLGFGGNGDGTPASAKENLGVSFEDDGILIIDEFIEE